MVLLTFAYFRKCIHKTNIQTHKPYPSSHVCWRHMFHKLLGLSRAEFKSKALEVGIFAEFINSYRVFQCSHVSQIQCDDRKMFTLRFGLASYALALRPVWLQHRHIANNGKRVMEQLSSVLVFVQLFQLQCCALAYSFSLAYEKENIATLYSNFPFIAFSMMQSTNLWAYCFSVRAFETIVFTNEMYKPWDRPHVETLAFVEFRIPADSHACWTQTE